MSQYKITNSSFFEKYAFFTHNQSEQLSVKTVCLPASSHKLTLLFDKIVDELKGIDHSDPLYSLLLEIRSPPDSFEEKIKPLVGKDLETFTPITIHQINQLRQMVLSLESHQELSLILNQIVEESNKKSQADLRLEKN